MENVRHLLRRAIAATWLWAVLSPAVVFAQQASTPDQPSLRNAPQPWLGYLVIVVLLAIVMVVSLMPSKRGHQD
jgi:membrane associated rhomboid family serine protease